VADRWQYDAGMQHDGAVVKMAAPLATCTKEEQRSVIHFLSSERGETQRNSSMNESSAL